MSLSVGIVGLPNTGKSTLFNALLGREVADTAPYPFCTVEPNVGVVEVPDERLEKLGEVIKPEKKIPAPVNFVDLAGLVKGAHKGEGLGNEFLSRIREVDVVLHLVRAFDAPEVDRAGSVDPETDIKTVNTELILKDLETVEKRYKDTKIQGHKEVLEKVRKVLDGGKFASEANLTEEELAEIKDLNLLTLKPQLVVINVGEDLISSEVATFRSRSRNRRLKSATSKRTDAISICAKVEEELSEFTPRERKEYLSETGISELSLDRVIKECHRLLDLVTFYTIKGGKIVQAWPIKRGSSVIEAAGLVHSDFARNFIRAEVIPASELLEVGSWLGAKEKGLVEVRGRDYVVCNGDVVEFKI